MTILVLVLTQTEDEIDDAISTKIQEGYTYSGNKHFSEHKQEWIATFSKDDNGDVA